MSTIVPGESVNKATPKNVVSHSTFRMDPKFFTTMRFGEYQPHLAFEGVPKDKISLRSAHEVRSYTLGSPLLSDVFIKKDYFAVPMQCVLPINWEKVYRNPKNGSDVNAALVSTSVEDFPAIVRQICLHFIQYATASGQDNNSRLTRQLKAMLTMERFLSAGSLLANLGASLSRLCGFAFNSTDSRTLLFDKAFDLWINSLIQNISRLDITIDNGAFTVVLDGSDVDADLPGSNNISLRDFLCIARDDSSFSVNGITFKEGVSALPEWPRYTLWSPSATADSAGFPVNLGRAYSYQIVCAHYFSNDNVDYIFSADLYRQNVRSLAMSLYEISAAAQAWPTFVYNGVETQYDVCSAKIFLDLSAVTISDLTGQDIDLFFTGYYDYLRLILGFNRSLRFQDYFTGSRSQPLAVGDVGAQVVSGKVSAINTTRSIQMQRFLNAVNRLPQKIESYLEGIFPGDRPRPDQHDPIWLGHTGDVVFGSEVENTGSAQFDPEKPVSVTSVLRGNASDYAFEFTVDRPCWILGITYFDIPRSYYKGVQRMLQHVDRFDMFNPFMQFVGDQPVMSSELDSYARNTNFAYTLRHMEYKQEYDRAAGGFAAGLLPGWTFLADDDHRRDDETALRISPDYIRSRPSEMDKFYLSLSGWSLASYFHFIVKNNNDITANRDMVYAPSIL